MHYLSVQDQLMSLKPYNEDSLFYIELLAAIATSIIVIS